MSLRSIQSLIGRTVFDHHLRSRLLHGPREALLQQYPLTPEEAECLASIQADSLDDFAAEVEHRLTSGRAVSLGRTPSV